MKAFWVLAVSAAILLPSAAQAEIYKWKDSNGVTRYSDTPPPSNVKQLPVGGKKPPAAPAAGTNQSTGAAPQGKVEQGSAEQKKPEQPAKEVKPAQGRDEAAIKRQEAAEAEKKKVQQQEAEAKARQENCDNAKKRLATYTLGGRIYDVDEKGERVYKSDADIAKGLEEAKQDVEKYCSAD